MYIIITIRKRPLLVTGFALLTSQMQGLLSKRATYAARRSWQSYIQTDKILCHDNLGEFFFYSGGSYSQWWPWSPWQCLSLQSSPSIRWPWIIMLDGSQLFLIFVKFHNFSRFQCIRGPCITFKTSSLTYIFRMRIMREPTPTEHSPLKSTTTPPPL